MNRREFYMAVDGLFKGGDYLPLFISMFPFLGGAGGGVKPPAKEAEPEPIGTVRQDAVKSRGFSPVAAALKMGMSPRTFYRAYKSLYGELPEGRRKRWVTLKLMNSIQDYTKRKKPDTREKPSIKKLGAVRVGKAAEILGLDEGILVSKYTEITGRKQKYGRHRFFTEQELKKARDFFFRDERGSSLEAVSTSSVLCFSNEDMEKIHEEALVEYVEREKQ